MKESALLSTLLCLTHIPSTHPITVCILPVTQGVLRGAPSVFMRVRSRWKLRIVPIFGHWWEAICRDENPLFPLTGGRLPWFKPINGPSQVIVSTGTSSSTFDWLSASRPKSVTEIELAMIYYLPRAFSLRFCFVLLGFFATPPLVFVCFCLIFDFFALLCFVIVVVFFFLSNCLYFSDITCIIFLTTLSFSVVVFFISPFSFRFNLIHYFKCLLFRHIIYYVVVIISQSIL